MQADGTPIIIRLDRDRAAERRRLLPGARARKAFRSALARQEDQRLDARIRRRDLTRAAEEIEVRRDDLVRGIVPQDHRHAVDVELRRHRRIR